MIIHKLTLQNFRQFKGIQTIEFAGATKGHQNVTVVFGENGRGKTGIFRAMIFCLFGARRLPQDGDVPDSELQLVNISALEQSEGKPVETYVELDFAHKGRIYSLRRAILGLHKNGQFFEESSEMGMAEITPDGNSKIVSPDRIGAVVNSVLDERVKDYFLFDGEKIERLTRADVSQRREIAKGIRNLLNVNALEIAIKVTEKLTKDIEEQLRKEASPELARLLKRLADSECRLDVPCIVF